MARAGFRRTPLPLQRLEPKPVHAVKRTVNLFISPPMALRSSRHSSQYGRNSAQLGITIVSKGAKTQASAILWKLKVLIGVCI